MTVNHELKKWGEKPNGSRRDDFMICSFGHIHTSQEEQDTSADQERQNRF